MSRTVSWFSCGAASAVATKIALSQGPVTIAYCRVEEEHPDNARFLSDCQDWFGQEIIILCNEKYDCSIYSVFEKTRYLVGPSGARCTKELKKAVREAHQRHDDNHIFGYTIDEIDRVNDFIDANNDINIIAPLVDAGLTKADCLAMVQDAGIELPAMYKLGYQNNNCRGCVKASSPNYWRKIDTDFPEFFQQMNAHEKMLGRAVCKIGMPTVAKNWPEVYEQLGRPMLLNPRGNPIYWRPQLHELPKDIIAMDNEPDIQCGIFCEIAKHRYESTIAGGK